MKEIDHETPLFKLTVGEFLSLSQASNKFQEKKYEYGYKGIQKLFNVSRSKAYKLLKSKMLSEAVFKNGRQLIIDKEKAIELYNKSIQS